ncbi:MAG: response regulator [Deltaproteobacteria bacterium]|nr:response regulator [Deltaproteobacteria bacterium]
MQQKVLIVDDDAGIRDTLSDLVRLLGYSTSTAENGLKAMELFDDGPYLCVFTDIMMPKMTGLELIKEVKARDVSTPVVVITGYASVEMAIDAMKYGASDFISKPFKMKQIEFILKKVEREKKLLQENKKFSEELTLHRLIDHLSGQLEKSVEEISTLHAISDKITRLKGIKDIVNTMVDVTGEILDTADVCFYLLDGATGKFIDLDSGSIAELNRGIMGGNIVRNRVPGSFDGQDLEILFPLMIEDRLFGALRVVSSNGIDSSKEAKLSYLLQRIVERMENVVLYEGLYENILSTLDSMAKILDARDPHTSRHSTRVTELSMRIGKALGLSDEDLDVLKVSASLHDIGKVGVPDKILLKKGKLTVEEMDIIKKHPDIGFDILSSIIPMKKDAEIIRHHHERYDGKGYPMGLKGEDIPFLSRIITLADAFDAMTSDRPYRKALPYSVALQEIKRCRGTQFDPGIVDVFIRKVITPKI